MKAIITLLVIAILLQAYLIFELSQETKSIGKHIRENPSLYSAGDYEERHEEAHPNQVDVVDNTPVTQYQPTDTQDGNETKTYFVENSESAEVFGRTGFSEEFKLSDKATYTFNQFLGLSDNSSIEQIQEVSSTLHQLNRKDYQAVMRKLIIESNKGNIDFDIAFIN